MGSRICALAGIAGGVVLIGGRSALAIPSLTPHVHDNQATTWKPPGSPTTEHQHRDTHPLKKDQPIDVVAATGTDPAYGFLAARVWDNRSQRYDYTNDTELTDFAHGYIAAGNNVRYKFIHGSDAGDWNTDSDAMAMKVVINKAFTTWMNAVNGNEMNSNGVPINIRIGFEEVAADQTAEVKITLGDVTGSDIGVYYPKAQELSWTYQASFWDYDPSNGITAGRQDFTYTALHEIGHLLGLKHYGTDPFKNLMNGDLQEKGRLYPGIDIGSLHGVKDLYAVAFVPEPGVSIAGMMLGAIALKRRRD